MDSGTHVFSGPYCNGSSRAGSDLDILVDPVYATLLDLAKAQQELEDALGVLVDLGTPLDLLNGFGDKVLAELKSL